MIKAMKAVEQGKQRDAKYSRGGRNGKVASCSLEKNGWRNCDLSRPESAARAELPLPGDLKLSWPGSVGNGQVRARQERPKPWRWAGTTQPVATGTTTQQGAEAGSPLRAEPAARGSGRWPPPAAGPRRGGRGSPPSGEGTSPSLEAAGAAGRAGFLVLAMTDWELMPGLLYAV